MARFAATVPFYESARQPYGKEFFATVASEMMFDRTQRLLDVGTGPGVLALGFAPYFREVVGLDPEAAMLDAARQAAERSGVALRLIEGKIESLPNDIGEFDVVAIGRALHWMDRDPTRLALDRVVAAGGKILICRAASVADGRNPWLTAYNDVRKQWSDPADAGRHSLDLDSFFSRTRFRHRASIAVEVEQAASVEILIDRVLSMSSSSLDRIGDGVDEMRRAIRAAMEPFASHDRIQEIVVARAEIFQADQ